MKLPFDIGATSPPAGHPDLEPGMAQKRDQALDADAAAPIPRPEEPTGPTATEEEVGAELDASLAEARERLTDGLSVIPTLVDPLEALRKAHR